MVARMTLAAPPAIFAPLQVDKGERLQDPTETRDGHTMFLTIAGHTRTVIVELHRDAAGSWRLARTAPFSGTWSDLEEVLTPDDRAMIFASTRPLPGGTGGGNIWVVRRSAAGWGNPQPLGVGVNTGTSAYSPAIAADGTLYFMRSTGKSGLFHIFVSSPPYSRATLAPFASATAAEFDPTVSPDGKTVVFSSTRAPLPKGTSHLFITYRHGSAWTTPRDLGPAINGFSPHNIEPRILPGQLCWDATKTLYCAPMR
jgi:hypothetical protein